MKAVSTRHIKRVFSVKDKSYNREEEDFFDGNISSLEKMQDLVKFTLFTRIGFEDENGKYPGYVVDETHVYLGKRYTLDDVERIQGSSYRLNSCRSKGVQYFCLTGNFNFVEMENGAMTFEEYKSAMEENATDKSTMIGEAVLAQVSQIIRGQEEAAGDLTDNCLSEYQRGIIVGQLIACKKIAQEIRNTKPTILKSVSSKKNIGGGRVKA